MSSALLLAQLLGSREKPFSAYMCASHLPAKLALSSIPKGSIEHTTVSVTYGVGVQPRGGVTLFGRVETLLSPERRGL